MATSYTSNKKIGALDSASTPLAASNEIVINQNGDILKTPLSAVEAKVFDAKTAITNPSGTEVVVVRQTDNTLRQVALSDIVPAGNITNAKVSASAAIEDTKLATINTAGKVTNNAVQATSDNTANRIVARDGSGNFSAGTITATLSGNATTATTAATANQTANTLTRGNYLTGNNFNGAAATTWAVDADTANTANKVVARDASGNFAAGTITANLAGNVTGNVTGNSDTATNLSSNRTFALTGEVTGSVSSNLSSGASIAATITNGAVVTAKIADANVTTSKIADASVTTAKIADANVTTAKLATATQQALIPAGAVMPFAMNSAPSGWLAADGTAVSRSAYAALFSAIGTAHGSGDGSTTFNLPDLRGIFVRGSGSQTISGTAYSGTFAAKQQDAFKSHLHPYSDYYERSAVTYANGLDGSASRLGVNGFSNTGLNTARNTSSTGDTETRPANIALLYCIKF